MTTDELLDACAIAEEAGEEVSISPQQLRDLVETLEAQDGQIDATWRAIGIDPQDARTAMDLANEVRKRIVQAKRKAQAAEDLARAALKIDGGDALAEAHKQGWEMGRNDARAAAMGVLQSLEHPGADHVSVLIQNAIRELE